MVAVTILLSKYTILYCNVIQLVVTIQFVARRWTATVPGRGDILQQCTVSVVSGIATGWRDTRGNTAMHGHMQTHTHMHTRMSA